MDLLGRRRRMMLRRKTETDPAKMPLTFEILSNGEITWRIGVSGAGRTIEYSKNGGAWTAITSTLAGVAIPVVTGDVLKFRGNVWPGSGSTNYSFFGSTCSFSAKGNPASLRYGQTLTGDEALASYCYCGLFHDCAGLTDASELALPATTLATYCYQAMFLRCTSLTEAPELPATTLASYCYQVMFSGCSILVSVKCLATGISATSALSNWLDGVAASGTFTKKAGVEWPSGTSGIPSGWTVVEEQ